MISELIFSLFHYKEYSIPFWTYFKNYCHDVRFIKKFEKISKEQHRILEKLLLLNKYKKVEVQR